MWVTALVGMATKYSEVTLAQRYREVEKEDLDPYKWEGTVSGGPMYYIERGLGRRWRPLAVFFALMLGTTAFLTGNAIQANTVADTLSTEIGLPVWISGLVTASVVAMVVIGGITRIGKVTGVLAPTMAAIYVTGALAIIVLNLDMLFPTFGLIFREAFNPTASIAGSGAGVFLLTMVWGVKRGLFSNEAGQGSAPIAHAAAKTDEPVSEGVVALVEPFIDTIVICTMTGLVIIMTGVWNIRVPTELTLDKGDVAFYVEQPDGGYDDLDGQARIQVENGRYVGSGPGTAVVAWHEVPVEPLYVNAEQTQLFSGIVDTDLEIAISPEGTEYTSLHGDAAESGAPLTMIAFERGLPGDFGKYIVLISVFLFAISTAIAWSYYGDRRANYRVEHRAVLPAPAVWQGEGAHFGLFPAQALDREPGGSSPPKGAAEIQVIG
jgi:AGCS family alanine or glycine:cation symporter